MMSGAYKQWEFLQDVITNGYKDAYKLHLGALTDMHKAKVIAEQNEAKWCGVAMFVFSVVSVGFAGGLVGGVIAPWVREAQANVANAALRQGAQRGLPPARRSKRFCGLSRRKPSEPGNLGLKADVTQT